MKLRKEFELAVIIALLILPFAVFFASQLIIASRHLVPWPGIEFSCDFGTPENCLTALGGTGGMAILIQYLEGGSVANAQMTQAFSELILTYGSTGRQLQLQLETQYTCTIVNVSDPNDTGTTLNTSCPFSPSEKQPVITIYFPSGQRSRSDVFISRNGISIQPKTWEHMGVIVQTIRNIVAPDVYERIGNITAGITTGFNNSSLTAGT